MLVTELGILMEAKALQPSKVRPSMLVTELGILMEGKELQPWYLDVVDYQLFAVNTVEKWIGCHLWVYGK